MSPPQHSHSDDAASSHSHSHEGIGLFHHNHSHSHQPNELLAASLSNPAVRITWVGLLVNIGLAVSKGIGGFYFHSQSLIADAIHSFSDMVADFLTLATVNVASKVGTPDRFPLGYGKIETLGSLLVSGVLLFAGISVGWSSLLQVFEYALPPTFYDYASKIQIGHSHSHLGFDTHDTTSLHQSHSHSHGPELTEVRQIPDINAAWLAGGSIIIKELLFQKTIKVANQTNSKVLVANAWHHRVDSLTAFVAVLTVTGGNFFNVAWLDSVGGLLVSGLIIRAGWGSFKTAVLELVDRGDSKTTQVSLKWRDLIKDEISDTDFKISNLSVLTSGANTNIVLTLASTSNHELSSLNETEFHIKKAIQRADRFVRNVFIKFDIIDQEQYDHLTDDIINTDNKK